MLNNLRIERVRVQAMHNNFKNAARFLKNINYYHPKG